MNNIYTNKVNRVFVVVLIFLLSLLTMAHGENKIMMAQRTNYLKLIEGRTEHSMSLLPDGRVLITGGQSENGKLLTSAEILDIDHRTIKMIRFPIPRKRHITFPLSNGRVIILGGVDEDGNPVRQIEIFDHKEEKFSLLFRLKNPRREAAIVYDFKNTIIITGGFDKEGNPLKSMELFDLKRLKHSLLKEEMVYARTHHQAVLVANKWLLLTGGIGVK